MFCIFLYVIYILINETPQSNRIEKQFLSSPKRMDYIYWKKGKCGINRISVREYVIVRKL